MDLQERLVGVIKIGEGFKLPDSFDIGILDKLEVYRHKYGSPQPDASVFRWMQYSNEGNYAGYIAFARDLGTHLPAVADHIAHYLSGVIDVPIDPHRIGFMCTGGNITPHRDEGGRKTCINIGLRDSDSAITRVSLDDDFDTFDTEYEDHTVQNGCAYMLNVARIHAVFQQRSARRLLVTYGMGASFDVLRTKL